MRSGEVTPIALALRFIVPAILLREAREPGERSVIPDVRLFSASEKSLPIAECVSYPRLQCALSVYPNTGNALHQ